MRTLASPVEGSEVRVEPTDSPGITVNGIPVALASVCKADVRVDLAAEGRRAFVVEHALGPLGLHGVTAAAVTGSSTEWEFARPEHRFCYSKDLGPSAVVGHPDGLPNPALLEALGDAGVLEEGPTTRTTVTDPVRYATNGGRIRLEPRDYGAGVRFEATFGDATVTAEIDPGGDNDPALLERIAGATTPYLSPTDEEAATHALADLVSDLVVLGGFDDVAVTVDLGDAYHALTVGVARKAHGGSLVTDREG